MGRIKTVRIKRVTTELLEKHPDDFKESFEDNKKILGRFSEIQSRKIRNIVAGYITRRVRARKAG